MTKKAKNPSEQELQAILAIKSAFGEIHPRADDLFKLFMLGRLSTSTHELFFMAIGAETLPQQTIVMEAVWLLHNRKWEEAMLMISGAEIDERRANMSILSEYAK